MGAFIGLSLAPGRASMRAVSVYKPRTRFFFGLLLLSLTLPGTLRAEPMDELMKRFAADTYQKELDVVTGVIPVRLGTRRVKITDRFLPENIAHTRGYIKQRLRGMGYATIHEGDFEIDGRKEPYVKENPAERPPGKNFWVEIPGSERPEEIITLGAHYDSTGKGMAGANDNGSGFVSALQIAEAFAGSKPKRTIRLVLFDGEEMPPYFQGSKDYFMKSKAAGEKNVLFLNLDQIGFNPANSAHVGFSAKFQPKIVRLLKQANEVASLGIKPVAYDPYLSDNLSATREGIPATAFFEEGKDQRGRTVGYEHYHQGTDTPDRVTPEYAVKVTKWAAASLLLAANSSDTYENTPAQKQKLYANIADGFRDDEEPLIAEGWNAFAKSCAPTFSKLR